VVVVVVVVPARPRRMVVGGSRRRWLSEGGRAPVGRRSVLGPGGVVGAVRSIHPPITAVSVVEVRSVLVVLHPHWLGVLRASHVPAPARCSSGGRHGTHGGRREDGARELLSDYTAEVSEVVNRSQITIADIQQRETSSALSQFQLKEFAVEEVANETEAPVDGVVTGIIS